MEDEIAQLGDDLCFLLAVERSNERQIHRSLLVQGNQQSFLGAADMGDGRGLAHHVPCHDGGFRSLSRNLVVFLK